MQDLMRVSGIGKNDWKIDDYLEEINAHVLLFLFFFFFFFLEPSTLSKSKLDIPSTTFASLSSDPLKLNSFSKLLEIREQS
jgi:hypothetical protein